MPSETFPAYADERRSPRSSRTPDAPFDLRPAPQERNSPAPSRPAAQPTRVTPQSAVPPAAVYPVVPGQTPGLPAPTGPGGIVPVSGPAAPFGPDSRTGMPGHAVPAAEAATPVIPGSPITPGSPTTPGNVAPVSGPAAFQPGAPSQADPGHTVPVAGATPGVSFPAGWEDGHQGQDPTRPLDPRRSGQTPAGTGDHGPGSNPEDPTRPFDLRRTGAEGFGPGAERTQAIDPRALASFAASGQAPKPDEHTAVAGPRHGGDGTQSPAGRHSVGADPRHAAAAPAEDIDRSAEAPTARPFATEAAAQPVTGAPFATDPAAPPSTGAPLAAGPSTSGPGAVAPVTGEPGAVAPVTGGPGAVAPVTGGPGAGEPSTGEPETHGLGWLLSLSGLGATTPVPEAEPPVAVEEVPDTAQPLGWFAPGEPDDDSEPEEAEPEAETTSAEAEGIPAGDHEALGDVDDPMPDATDAPKRLHADYLTGTDESAEAGVSTDAEVIAEADSSDEHAHVEISADPEAPFAARKPGQTDESARIDGSGQADESGQTDESARIDGSGQADESGQTDESARVDGSGQADGSARIEESASRTDVTAPDATVVGERLDPAGDEAATVQDGAAEQTAVTSGSAVRDHDAARPEGFAGEESPLAAEGILPDVPGHESAVPHGGAEEISTETAADASEAVHGAEGSRSESAQAAVTVVPSSEVAAPAVSYLLAGTDELTEESARTPGTTDESTQSLGTTDESTEDPAPATTDAIGDTGAGSSAEGDAATGQATESVPAVDSASPAAVPETDVAVSEASGVAERDAPAGATFDGGAPEGQVSVAEVPSDVVVPDEVATGDSAEADEPGSSPEAGSAAEGGIPDDAEGDAGERETAHEGELNRQAEETTASAAVGTSGEDDPGHEVAPGTDSGHGDDPVETGSPAEAGRGERDSGAPDVQLNGVTPAEEEAGGAAIAGVAGRSREARPEARTEPVRQRRDQRAPADRRRADPEQILASYTWEFDPRTLREQVGEQDRLWDLVDRLTDRLEYAERDNVRAGLLGLRAVVSRVLGELDDALADGREAVRHAEASGELRPVSIAQARLAQVLQWRGEFAEADRLFAQADSPELPARIRAEISELAGRSAFEQGRYLEAVNHFERALDVRRGEDPELVERIELALDAITRRTGDGWGPYPRTRDELLGLPEAPTPLLDDGAGLWGYAAAVEPRYAEAQPFAEGVAWVRRPDSHAWELIDTGGELVIPAAHGYLAAGRFAEGLAWVTRGDATGWFAIDRQNRLVVAPGAYEDARPFRRGLAVVRQAGLWGAVDRHGRIAVRPRFRRFATVLHVGGPVDGFTDEGLAVVDAGERFGVLDRTGQLVVAAVHAAVVIHPSAFLVRNAAGLWGALDREGEPLVDMAHRDPAPVVDLLPDETRPVL
ncbi:WG repeat-containing protein [Actinoplanes hulinensis]|uniref:WG repeat-containing protein n=1 Tax=Actinoplanes hulinensis TaxID=1144547 RepID=A0ABS7B7A3_9ACTN|nr:WG repeat-containing protein [Actinoplanes hulinensis]MBW6436782.1 WG repeat-containing protein [Actinoplanes hulinensis]